MSAPEGSVAASAGWAATELASTDPPHALADEGSFTERHRALSWLVRCLNQQWDDVTTDT